MRSAIEIFAMSKLAKEGTKYYPSHPFIVLADKTVTELTTPDVNQHNYWSFDEMGMVLTHVRDYGSSKSWTYNVSDGELTSND